MTVVAIHQPNYLPYLGFFKKMMQSDIFVIYDNAQFNKEDYQHRNRIRIYQGWKYLTVPVEKKRTPINDIRIKNEIKVKGIPWNEAHLKEIINNYKYTPYFALYKDHLINIYQNKYDKLIELNMDIIYFLKNAFSIKSKIVFASQLGFVSSSTERLADITEALGGDVYLSGQGGLNYLDISIFESRGINVEFQDFKHPVYRQCYEGFIPNMSAIDVLFNVGKMPIE